MSVYLVDFSGVLLVLVSLISMFWYATLLESHFILVGRSRATVSGGVRWWSLKGLSWLPTSGTHDSGNTPDQPRTLTLCDMNHVRSSAHRFFTHASTLVLFIVLQRRFTLVPFLVRDLISLRWVQSNVPRLFVDSVDFLYRCFHCVPSWFLLQSSGCLLCNGSVPICFAFPDLFDHAYS